MNANIGRILGVVGKGVEGYGIDKQRRLTDALNATREKREAGRDAVLNALAVAQTTRLTNPTPEPVEYSPAKFMAGGKAVQGFTTKGGGYFDANRQPVADATPYEEPKAPTVPNLVPVDEPTPNGGTRRVLRPEAPGLEVPGPSNIMAGSAALKKAIASNQTQLSVLDDALKELDAHPEAVGLMRGIGEMIPLAGGIQDAVNQRADPAGVAARAQISNLGSLKIHDRSGVAVTVSEFPRLKPFIPTVGDTPEAIRTKLGKMREALLIETGELEKSMTTRPAGGATAVQASTGDPEFEALMAKYKKP